MIFSKSFLATMGAIVATGAILNLANSGMLGGAAQRFSKYVTTGYGAGAL